MSIRAEFARQLGDLAACRSLLDDLEADLDLALARQQIDHLMAAPSVLLAIQRAGCTQVYEVELTGVQWIEPDCPPAAGPPRPPRVWEEELPNRLVRPLGAAVGLGAMLHNATPPTLLARLIGDD